MPFAIESMQVGDIPAVAAIEKRCFNQPWPTSAYRKEIQTNRTAHYFVVRDFDIAANGEGEHEDLDQNGLVRASVGGARGQGTDPGLLDRLTRLFRGGQPTVVPAQQPATGGSDGIMGYAGMWLLTEEVHITTIAIDPEYQGRGVGELLLLGLIDRAIEIGARWLTLEVRVSNHKAQALYRKYTFKEMGLRRRYYSDNGEDALVMWTDPIESVSFQEAVRRHREALQRRIG